jgi:hypothetical protein
VLLRREHVHLLEGREFLVGDFAFEDHVEVSPVGKAPGNTKAPNPLPSTPRRPDLPHPMGKTGSLDGPGSTRHPESLRNGDGAFVSLCDVGDHDLEAQHVEGVSHEPGARLGGIALSPVASGQMPPHLDLLRRARDGL